MGRLMPLGGAKGLALLTVFYTAVERLQAVIAAALDVERREIEAAELLRREKG